MNEQHESIYYADHEFMVDVPLGQHEQVRYMQGNVDSLFVWHGGKWHTLSRGGIVSGDRGTMILGNPMHRIRKAKVTIEIGRRPIDTVAQRPVYLSDRENLDIKFKGDRRFNDIGENNNPSGRLRVIPIFAPPNEQILISFPHYPTHATHSLWVMSDEFTESYLPLMRPAEVNTDQYFSSLRRNFSPIYGQFSQDGAAWPAFTLDGVQIKSTDTREHDASRTFLIRDNDRMHCLVAAVVGAYGSPGNISTTIKCRFLGEISRGEIVDYVGLP